MTEETVRRAPWEIWPVGTRVWYWHRGDESQRWERGEVVGTYHKNGYGVLLVALDALPTRHWAWGWQIADDSPEPPPEPDLAETWP